MISGEDKVHWFAKLKHIQQDLSSNSLAWWMEEVEVPSSPLSVWKAALRAPRCLVVIQTTQWAWWQRILATNAKESERTTRDHKGGGCVYVRLSTYTHLARAEDSARRLISIPNECVLPPSDASCPPRCKCCSIMQRTCVFLAGEQCAHGVFKSKFEDRRKN